MIQHNSVYVHGWWIVYSDDITEQRVQLSESWEVVGEDAKQIE